MRCANRHTCFVMLASMAAFLSACNDDPSPLNNESLSIDGADPEHEDSNMSEFLRVVQTEPFGETGDGHPIVRYILQNENGLKVSVINFGAVVTSVVVPDRNGDFDNITLGFDSLAEYEKNAPYFGAICGRYANRIAGGKFSLDGHTYTLAINNEPNHLHGGEKPFNKVVWHAEQIESEDAVSVSFFYASPDGEEGYPGTLKVTVEYTLNNENELKIQYTATSDKSTPVNLTSHCYWNLAGAGSGDVLDHQLTLYCDQYLPVDETLIPTGELKSVKDTPMDFTAGETIGARIADVDGGYDHCYVIRKETRIRKESKPLTLAARVRDPKSGRVMEVLTTEPGIQLYTGNFLDGTEQTGGFDKHAGFCLECQHFPDSPNQPEFPTTILLPQHVYTQTTVHRFLVEE